MAIISISDSQVNGADQILVADGSSKIPAKDGSQITILNASNVATGTIASARLDTGTTANKLVLLDGSGNLPAVDASLLTGIVSATISASDPTISTNPSGGVGTEWNNSTSGEMYICTDATAGANVWKNVGAGSGDVAPWGVPGTLFGYSAKAGSAPGESPAYKNDVVEKYSFTTDANATTVGNQTVDYTGGFGVVGYQSDTYGYACGGASYPPTSNTNRIEKFSFASDGDGVDSGADLTRSLHGGQGHSSETHGFVSGGSGPQNTIDKYTYDTSTNATDHGDLSGSRYNSAGLGSETHGYQCGHSTGDNTIDKFSFASNTTASNVGNMTGSSKHGTGHMTVSQGYCVWGRPTSYFEKWAFASDGNSADVGDLPVPVTQGSGTSSDTNGYIVGGWTGSVSSTDIQKFSFANEATTSNAYDLVTHHGENPGGFMN